MIMVEIDNMDVAEFGETVVINLRYSDDTVVIA